MGGKVCGKELEHLLNIGHWAEIKREVVGGPAPATQRRLPTTPVLNCGKCRRLCAIDIS